MAHGPSYFRYDVYDDFGRYWRTGNTGDVYRNVSNNKRGGHAVLIIGWSDSKGAYLCKNSWGETAGPNNDGTFWIAYDGHTNNLGMQMFNITGLTRVATSESLLASKQDSQDVRQQRLSVGKSTSDTESTTAPFSIDPVMIESYGGTITVEAETEPSTDTDANASFGWYNNLRVNGSTTLTDTSGTTQLSVYARDVKWRFGFGSRAIQSPQGDGGVAGSGWRFPNAHKFGIVVVQGGNYWNVNSTSSSSPTVITGLSNTQPVTIYVNDTNGNDKDNGGSFDLFVRKDN